MSVSTSAAAAGHKPVLQDEAIAALVPRAGGRYIDGTFGGGGHTRELLAASAPDGIVLALDADPSAIARAEALRAESGLGARLIPVQSNFADLAEVATHQALAPSTACCLTLDSHRSSSIRRSVAVLSGCGPVDMRVDATAGCPGVSCLFVPEAGW